jgi:asparagine synthase (glutamine-hydrolysing)
MCGICGYVGVHRPELLGPMSRAMSHRGPDDAGTWSDEAQHVGLGHARLSIIDVSAAGHQPMASADGRVWLSYNGELYNFREHRKRLEERGYVFRGNSDTEVLLNLYLEYGDAFLQRLNGIFAFALWDSVRRRLLLARDHAGVKPLYYWTNGAQLYFASELKALLKVPEAPREINAAALPTYLTLLWVPGSETMLRGIRKLEPGQWLSWEGGQIRSGEWFQLDYTPDDGLAEEQWIDRTRSAFLETTARQMVSDVKLGAFLSGGLDSSSIVAAMRQARPDGEISCYSTAYDPRDLEREGIADDLPYAQRVAQHLRVDLKTVRVSPDDIRLLPRIVHQMEEPDADPSAILTYLIARLAHEDGAKVLMSGTGGDEVFFGYRSHRAYWMMERLGWLPKPLWRVALRAMEKAGTVTRGAQGPLARRARKMRRSVSAKGLSRHMALADWSDPATRNGILAPELRSPCGADTTPEAVRRAFESFSGEGELNRHSHVLVQTFLAAHNFLYTDKCAMAASVEVRVPFMDAELMKLCARIPESLKLKGGEGKFLLKRAMEPYLPAEVLRRPKTGFTPPLREWMATRLSPLMDELLSEQNLKARGFFDGRQVRRLMEENRSNVADHSYLLYALLSFELWCQTFIDRPAVQVSI